MELSIVLIFLFETMFRRLDCVRSLEKCLLSWAHSIQLAPISEGIENGHNTIGFLYMGWKTEPSLRNVASNNNYDDE
jgi:hypothetical protein